MKFTIGYITSYMSLFHSSILPAFSSLIFLFEFLFPNSLHHSISLFLLIHSFQLFPFFSKSFNVFSYLRLYIVNYHFHNKFLLLLLFFFLFTLFTLFILFVYLLFVLYSYSFFNSSSSLHSSFSPKAMCYIWVTWPILLNELTQKLIAGFIFHIPDKCRRKKDKRLSGKDNLFEFYIYYIEELFTWQFVTCL